MQPWAARAASSNKDCPALRMDRNRTPLHKIKNIMHTKRYRKLSQKLCEEAVEECFKGKWKRNDILTFIEKYAGIPRIDIIIDDLSGSRTYKTEAVEAIGLMLLGTVEDLVEYGIEPDDMVPVVIRSRPDGMTGKTRDIALLCIMHQLLGHVEKLMLEPLINARLLPTQHASIPNRGQTLLKDQAHRYLLKESLGAKYIEKTDVVHAYATTQYQVCVDLVKMEIPKAKYAIVLLEYLGSVAPGGHLIIGGYIDAWLFNFCMSYAIRDLYEQGTKRRGKMIPYVIRVGTFMDDFALYSTSIKGIQRAVKRLHVYFDRYMGIEVKTTTGILKILPIEEEKRRRGLPKKAQRGVPMLDMAGYRISRTHATIRRRVFRKARRQFIRGYRELKATGTLTRDRAQKIISYNSYVKQSDSYHLKEKYNIDELMKMARTVNAFYARLEDKKRKEKLNVLRERRRGVQPAEGNTGKSAGIESDRQAGRQHQIIQTGGSDDYELPFQ